MRSTTATKATAQLLRRAPIALSLLGAVLVLLFASVANAACPFAGKASASSSASASAPDATAAAAALQQREQRTRLAATARLLLLETDLSASLGLSPPPPPREERVFSFSSSPSAASAAEEGADDGGSGSGSSSSSTGEALLAEVLPSLVDRGNAGEEEKSLRRLRHRRRSRALSGLPVNLSSSKSIISEDDIILPDDALVRKILSKDATVEKNLVAGLANLTRSGAFKEMLRAELQALSQTPQRVYNNARATGNATKAAWNYEKTVKVNGTNSALAQQQRETVARAVFRVLAVPRDLGLLLRAAFHDAGTYNPSAPAGTSQGGMNGSLRKELSWPSNAGLVAAWPMISTGHKILNAKFNNSFTWADSIAIAGAAGVEKAGGPAIAVGLGRPDSVGADPRVGLATEPLLGINLTGDEAVAAWAQFGQSPETLATLMGAHTIGRSALTPLQGPLGPPSFTNYFYKAVLEQKCSFAVDNALAAQPQTAPIVQAYAADQALFFAEFSKHYRAMTWWGVAGGDPGV